MIDVSNLLLAGLSGAILGAMFFGGLWWTVNRGLASKQPALWFLISLLIRMSVVIACFYVVSGGRWERLTACLVGFIAARFIFTRFAQRPSVSQQHTPAEVSSAS
jgi:F1F0 ATPase subunit 2